MMEVADPEMIATVYHLINADVVDTDGDGLSDNLESLYALTRTMLIPMAMVKTIVMITTHTPTIEEFRCWKRIFLTLDGCSLRYSLA